MTDSLPPEQPTPQREPLGSDEYLAMFIAFVTLGGVLWWGLTRSSDGGFDFANLGVSADSKVETQPSLKGVDSFFEFESEDMPFIGGEDSSAAVSDDEESGQAELQRPFQAFSGGLSSTLQSGLGSGSALASWGRASSGLQGESGSDSPSTEVSSGLVGESTGQEGSSPLNIPGSTDNQQQADEIAPPASESVATAPLNTETPPPIDISDVDPDSWAYPFVTALYEKGFVPDFPDGQFQPDKLVTRAELAAALEQAFADSSGQRQLTFKDIPENYWASDAIEQAVKTEFMSGYPNGNFDPDATIPRYQVLVALVSGLKLAAPEDAAALLQRYSDQGDLPDWSRGQIATATQFGIVSSYPDVGQLRPNFPATRADVAVMIHQALVQTGQVDRVSSDYVVSP